MSKIVIGHMTTVPSYSLVSIVETVQNNTVIGHLYKMKYYCFTVNMVIFGLNLWDTLVACLVEFLPLD